LAAAREAGVHVVGLEARAPTSLRSVDLGRPTLLVIGNEHEGMKRATRKQCDTLAHLVPLRDIDSLNASVAAGAALYEAAVQRMKSDT
jgi:23S rRNA (guanosine2251-2'-O)-methyltransferase